MRTFPSLADEPNEFGYYEIRWSERVGGNWRTKRKSTKKTTRREAEIALAEFLSIKDSIEIQESRSLNDVWSAYLRNYSIPRGNDKTDEHIMKAPLKAFGRWKSHTIKNSDVEAYALRREGGAYGKRKVKPATIRREIVCLQAVLNYGSRNSMIAGEPEFSFPKPPDSAPSIHWLNEDQEKEVLESVKDQPDTVKFFLRVGLTYGPRKQAIMDLHFGPQIDFITNVIDFNVPGRRITRKRRPKAPMTTTIRADLERIYAKKSRGQRVCDWNTPYLFEKFMKSIGYAWVTPHVMKHTAITQMLRSGVSELDVAKLTATDIRTIQKVYRHYSQEELLNIAESRGI